MSKTENITPAPSLPPVLYQDEHLVVINKPAGLALYNKQGNQNGTLAEAIMEHLSPPSLGEDCEYGIIDRYLHKNTSGAMIIARTKDAYLDLRAARGLGLIRYIYSALVHNYVYSRNDNITQEIAPYDVDDCYDNMTLLDLYLNTSQTGHIRKKLADAGYPVYNDERYGSREQTTLTNRHFWHALVIYFRHPISGDEIRKEAKLPADLQAVLYSFAC